jgi:MFS family permease
MSSIPARSPSVPRAAAGASLFLGSYGVLMAALPAELVHRQYPQTVIGALIALHAVGAMASRIASGRAIDRFGARRTAQVAWLLLVAATALFSLAMLRGGGAIALLALAKLAQGTATATFLTAGYTYAAQHGDPAARGARVGLYGSIASVALLVAPPIGIALWSAGHGDIVWLLPPLLAIGAGALLPGDQAGLAPGQQGEDRLSIAAIGRRAAVAVAGLALSAALQGGSEAHFPALVKAYRAEGAIVWLYVGFGIALAVGKVGGGRMVDRMGIDTVFGAGLALLVLGLLAPLVIGGGAGLAMCGVLLGLGSGAVGTAAITALAAAVPATQAGAAIGVGGLLSEVGLATGAVVAGLLIAGWSVAAFFAAGTVAALAVLAAAAVRRLRSRARQPD